jgi:hypothetical protein
MRFYISGEHSSGHCAPFSRIIGEENFIDARCRAGENRLKTYLHGIWENKLVSIVRMQDTITSVKDVHEFMGSFQRIPKEKQVGFLEDNVNSLIDAYLLIEMLIRDQDVRIEERAALLNAEQ